MNDIKEIDYSETKKVLESIDKKDFFDPTPSIPEDEKVLCDTLSSFFEINKLANRAVLGIDIYKYSKYPILQ